MVVNQECVARAIGITREACQVDLPDGMQREFIDYLPRISPMVRTRNMDIVDIQQETASGALDDLGHELPFAHGRSFKFDVSGRIFQKHAQIQTVLHLIDMIANPAQGSFIVRQREQIVEKNTPVTGPGKVLGKHCRPVSPDQAMQPVQMRSIQGILSTQGHANPVQ